MFDSANRQVRLLPVLVQHRPHPICWMMPTGVGTSLENCGQQKCCGDRHLLPAPIRSVARVVMGPLGKRKPGLEVREGPIPSRCAICFVMPDGSGRCFESRGCPNQGMGVGTSAKRHTEPSSRGKTWVFDAHIRRFESYRLHQHGRVAESGNGSGL